MRLRLPYSQEELADAIELAARACLDEGITACAEAGIGGGLLGHSPVELGAYQLLRDRGRLPLRIQLMASGDTLRPRTTHADDGFPRALDLGLRTGFGDDWLSLGALKIYTDGGMMARTAALTSPYGGTVDNVGRFQDDPGRIADLIVDGHLAGWQLAVHAIGDRAADLALDALERAQKLRPRPDARHRIEHAGLIRPDQLAPVRRARRERGGPAELPAPLRRRLRDGDGPGAGRLAVPGQGIPGPRGRPRRQLGPPRRGRFTAAGDPVHGRTGLRFGPSRRPGRGRHRRRGAAGLHGHAAPTPAAGRSRRAPSRPVCAPTWWCWATTRTAWTPPGSGTSRSSGPSWTAVTPWPRGDATLGAMRAERAEQVENGASAAWVAVVSYENLPGCPRPPAALRA